MPDLTAHGLLVEISPISKWRYYEGSVLDRINGEYPNHRVDLSQRYIFHYLCGHACLLTNLNRFSLHVFFFNHESEITSHGGLKLSRGNKTSKSVVAATTDGVDIVRAQTLMLHRLIARLCKVAGQPGSQMATAAIKSNKHVSRFLERSTECSMFS